MHIHRANPVRDDGIRIRIDRRGRDIRIPEITAREGNKAIETCGLPRRHSAAGKTASAGSVSVTAIPTAPITNAAGRLLRNPGAGGESNDVRDGKEEGNRAYPAHGIYSAQHAEGPKEAFRTCPDFRISACDTEIREHWVPTLALSEVEGSGRLCH